MTDNRGGGGVHETGPGEELPDTEPQVFDTDRVEDKRAILEPTRLRLLQQILATEWGSLSAPELAYRNTDLSESTVRDHLRAMANRPRPFVEKLKVEDGKRAKGIPWTYYAVSEYGIELLKEVGAYEGITVLYQMYDRMEREPIADIEAFDHRPTPDWL
jgi:DNA-binding transcriptional ArsR family regulator